MTDAMRKRVMRALEVNPNMTIESCQRKLDQKRREAKAFETAPSWDVRKYMGEMLKSDIAYFEAVIEILTEMAEIEIANEAVQTVISTFGKVAKTSLIRKVVAVMANKLRKLNYTLSGAFKRAWGFVKAAVP